MPVPNPLGPAADHWCVLSWVIVATSRGGERDEQIAKIIIGIHDMALALPHHTGSEGEAQNTGMVYQRSNVHKNPDNFWLC
jgi:hypothetical protein